MGAKSIGFARGAAAGGTCGLLTCCGSKERLAKRFWPFGCLMSVLGVCIPNGQVQLNSTSEAKKYHY